MNFKLSIIFFCLLSSFSINQTGVLLERTKLALKTGNSQKLVQLMGDKIQFGFEGEAAVITQKEANHKLENFFKVNSPSDLNQLFQGQSKDGSQYYIGKLTTSKGEFRVSVYWKEVDSKLTSIDITKE